MLIKIQTISKGMFCEKILKKCLKIVWKMFREFVWRFPLKYYRELIWGKLFLKIYWKDIKVKRKDKQFNYRSFHSIVFHLILIKTIFFVTNYKEIKYKKMSEKNWTKFRDNCDIPLIIVVVVVNIRRHFGWKESEKTCH